MNSTELRDKFRIEAFDLVQPYLWEDEEIFEFMDDAQKMFCRLVEGIPDATSDVAKIFYVTGEPFAPIDPRILKIRKVIRAEDYKNVAFVNFEDIGHNLTEDYRRPMYDELDDRTGEVTQIVLGMEQDQVRLVKIPEVDGQLDMIIYRLPMEDIVGEGQDLEIHTQHHVHLLHWMKHRAYSKHDAETFNKGKADEFEARFHQYCTRARIEMETRKHKPRTVMYGGY